MTWQRRQEWILALALAVLVAGCPAGSSSPDAGGVDAGTGALDAGPGAVDAGPGVDAGQEPLDAGPGPGDAGAPEAGEQDAGPEDAGTVDVGSQDAGTVDAGTQGAGGFDAGSCPGNARMCTNASECPSPESDCITATCESGCCGTSDLSVDASCETNGGHVCNGSGTCVQCVTPADCGNTGTACSSYTCTDNVCGESFAVAETTCTDNGGAVCNGMGICVQCVAPADCGSTGTDCSSFTCNSNTCSQSPAAAETACSDSGGQVCNGTGSCVQCVMPSDCGSTGTSCASSKCTGNACGESFAVEGTTCSDHGGAICNGMGACVPLSNGVACTSSLQCASNHCVDGVCCNAACTGACTACSAEAKGQGSDGVCGAVAAGLNPGGQCTDQGAASCGTTGVCNGSGACQEYASGTPCAAPSCVSPEFTPAATCDGSGTCVPGSPMSCSGATPVCDDSGCVACNSPSDCPATGSDCITATCTSNTCGTSNVAYGTALPPADQVSGDCQTVVCDGSGGTTTVANASNLPTPTSTCQMDPTCTGSTPSFTPAPTGTPCTSASDPNAQVCGNTGDSSVAGTCVECNDDEDCLAINDAGTLTCSSNHTCQ